MEVKDQASDKVGRELYRINNQYGSPDFVKAASSSAIYAAQSDGSQLPAGSYADQAGMKFPCHTAASTWVSTAFLHEKRAEVDPAYFERVDQRLRQFAEAWQVSDACDDLRQKVASVDVEDFSDVSDDKFAFVIEQDGRKERYCPLRFPEEVKTAAEWLVQHRGSMNWNDRHKAAKAILSQSELQSAPLGAASREVEKMAGEGMGTRSHLDSSLAERENAAIRSGHPGLRDKIAALREGVAERGEFVFDKPFHVKMAGVIDELDRELDSPTNPRGFEAPEDILFGIAVADLEKVASEHIALQSGSVYQPGQLNNIKTSHLRDWMGDDFVDAVTQGGVMVDVEKMASILPTLPRGDADMFDRMFAETGAQPFGKQAAAAVTLTHHDMLAMAADTM